MSNNICTCVECKFQEEGKECPYTYNKTNWELGDIVIHDADAKRTDMLMRIIKKALEKDYDTNEMKIYYYVSYCNNPRLTKDYGLNKTWRNSLKVLHDPKKFDIKVPENLLRSTPST